jgi:hypothetical protein
MVLLLRACGWYPDANWNMLHWLRIPPQSAVASSQRSASMAAMQPEPAAVIAWR